MGDSAHTTNHTNTGKKSAPPLFLEDENIFQKSATMVPWGIEFPMEPGRVRGRGDSFFTPYKF
jgi:hypothetical protein